MYLTLSDISTACSIVDMQTAVIIYGVFLNSGRLVCVNSAQCYTKAGKQFIYRKRLG